MQVWCSKDAWESGDSTCLTNPSQALKEGAEWPHSMGVTAISLGPHKLKGVAEEVTLMHCRPGPQ